jgi:hypothetical protein
MRRLTLAQQQEANVGGATTEEKEAEAAEAESGAVDEVQVGGGRRRRREGVRQGARTAGAASAFGTALPQPLCWPCRACSIALGALAAAAAAVAAAAAQRGASSPTPANRSRCPQTTPWRRTATRCWRSWWAPSTATATSAPRRAPCSAPSSTRRSTTTFTRVPRRAAPACCLLLPAWPGLACVQCLLHLHLLLPGLAWPGLCAELLQRAPHVLGTLAHRRQPWPAARPADTLPHASHAARATRC